MHSCKLFGTTGLAGGFLVTKNTRIQANTGEVLSKERNY